jgi:hypothetical protein
MDNGKYSGWMYTINGFHPGFGLKEREIRNGDIVVWHYVNDFTYEVEDWFEGASLGNSATWSKWLDAKDVNPPGSSGGNPDENPGGTPGNGKEPDKETDDGNALVVESGKQPTPFSDVSMDAWFLDAVSFVYAQGLMKGTSDTQFSPKANLTRAMLVTILYRNEKEPAVSQGSQGNAYTDVAEDLWYTDATAWAAANGIVNGYGDGRFGPADDITREQLVLMLYNYAVWKEFDVSKTTDLTNYSDLNALSGWAKDAMAWAVASGIIIGRTGTTLAPQGTATRAEAATLLMRFIKNMPE